MLTPLAELQQQTGEVPLCWVTVGRDTSYFNLGDALSPVMVAALSGQRVTHAAMHSSRLRMCAVGTIGHSLVGGEVWVWGTGASRYSNPLAAKELRELYRPPAGTKLVVTATRGPISRHILGEENAVGPAVYGDPVWLLPRFYRPPVEKKHELGVILHLSELTDRAYEAHPKPGFVRYQVPADLGDSVVLINTITPPTLRGLADRLDDILACKRIVSTSLHGMVIAESYGIPCLYFSTRTRRNGGGRIPLDPEGTLNLRVTDLYQGLGRTELNVYAQRRITATDWQDVCDTVDRLWEPVTLDEDRLIDAFPLPVARRGLPDGIDVFEDPAVGAIDFRS
jgi:pyruvyltransferase